MYCDQQMPFLSWNPFFKTFQHLFPPQMKMKEEKAQKAEKYTKRGLRNNLFILIFNVQWGIEY